MSQAGLCEQCGENRLNSAVLQMHHKNGPFYERRREGLLRAEFGPRVALALKQAGFVGPTVDDSVARA